MRPVQKEVFVVQLKGLALALGIVLAIGSAASADIQTSGRITYVSPDALEINGKRVLVTSESYISSSGREVSVTSLRRGMFAEVEIDDAGQLIALEANGVVE